MPKVSFDEIAAKVDQKYDSLDIELSPGQVVRLRNPIRLSDAERAKLSKLASVATKDAGKNAPELTEAQQEAEFRKVIAALESILTLVADTPEGGKGLVDKIAGDAPTLMQFTEDYFEALNVGEASPSQK